MDRHERLARLNQNVAEMTQSHASPVQREVMGSKVNGQNWVKAVKARWVGGLAKRD